MEPESGEWEDDDMVIQLIPFSALRQPTNLEIAELIGLSNAVIISAVAAISTQDDIMAEDDDRKATLLQNLLAQQSVADWWKNLVTDPEFKNRLEQMQKEMDEDDE